MTAAEEKRRIRESFLKVFHGDDGAKVLRALADFAHADTAEFCADPRRDAYMQGRRSVVMEIRNIMEGEYHG